MLHCDLSQQEQHRRKEIAEHTRQMLLTELRSTVRMKLRSWASIGIITCRSLFPSCTR